MKKLLLTIIGLTLFIVSSNAAMAGDCKTRDTVNWHATITSAVYVRADCPTGDAIAVVPAGEVIQILEVDRFSEFYLIKTSVGTGFVFSSFLKDINKSPLPGTETYPDSAFIDLNPNHKYYDEIADVKEKGIVSGTPEGEIKADDSVNRAELAKILVEATFEDEEIAAAVLPSNAYSDIESGAWYLPYLQLAKERKIMSGDDNGSNGTTTVRPADFANGAEVAKMIAVAFTIDIPAPGEGANWYIPYMDVLEDMNALPYSSADHLVTRGEMMFMISTILSNQS